MDRLSKFIFGTDTRNGRILWINDVNKGSGMVHAINIVSTSLRSRNIPLQHVDLTTPVDPEKIKKAVATTRYEYDPQSKRDSVQTIENRVKLLGQYVQTTLKLFSSPKKKKGKNTHKKEFSMSMA